ncbi:MAG: bifunctional UDP-N-acetylglucosamine diphosphorylase/glucosamine-1-phosphate N-acetyltransferase GlmU [Nocardioides sp.]
MSDNLIVIVLAAGNGTRMRSTTSKVLHAIGGRSMIWHVLNAVEKLEPRELVTVIGAQREQVGPHVSEHFPNVLLALQETQDGTGHAVRVALEALGERSKAGERAATVLVAYGDTPLLRAETLRQFVADHDASEGAVSILSGIVDDPNGYGRIVRTPSGDVAGIVEHKDASHEQRLIREINSGILAIDAGFLAESLPALGNGNASGEFYLTDIVAMARAAGLMVAAFPLGETLEIQGVNDRAQLAALGQVLNRRLVHAAMLAGVTVVDPDSTWIDVDVQIAPDVTILPGTQLLGRTTIESGSVIGPDTTLRDTEVSADATVLRSHCLTASVGAGATVGPFSYLRPGTVVADAAKVGAFVESKNSFIGPGAKVPHLSYVGDAEIGEGANIGAGTIFANYDGIGKHRSRVGRYARTASNNTFVAPVEIGDGAATGAGAVIRRDVPPGALAVSSGPQRHIAGWVQRRWPGTMMAKAAEAWAGPLSDAGAGAADCPPLGPASESVSAAPSSAPAPAPAPAPEAAGPASVPESGNAPRSDQE